MDFLDPAEGGAPLLRMRAAIPHDTDSTMLEVKMEPGTAGDLASLALDIKVILTPHCIIQARRTVRYGTDFFWLQV